MCVDTFSKSSFKLSWSYNYKFCKPNTTKENIVDYYEVVSQYLFFKKYPSAKIEVNKNGIINEKYFEFLNDVKNNFELYYGEFISAVLRDIPAVIMPLERIALNPYINQLIDLTEICITDEELINMSEEIQ